MKAHCTDLSTWVPGLYCVTAKDVIFTFYQHKSRTFIITAAMKVSRSFSIIRSSEQQRTGSIRRKPWYQSWVVIFSLYYGGALKCWHLLLKLINNTLNLVKCGLCKQFFSNCSVLWTKKVTIAKVIQNVPYENKQSIHDVNIKSLVYKCTGIYSLSSSLCGRCLKGRERGKMSAWSARRSDAFILTFLPFYVRPATQATI